MYGRGPSAHGHVVWQT